MLERDLRLLKRLVEAGPGVPLYLDYPDFPSVLETVKLLGSDTSDENFREVWLPKDMYDVVAPHIDDVLKEGELSGLVRNGARCLGLPLPLRHHDSGRVLRQDAGLLGILRQTQH